MPIKAPEHEVILKKRTESTNWEMTSWCTQKFGKRWSAIDNREGRWCCFWGGREYPGYYRWSFKDEKDLVLFLLRWA